MITSDFDESNKQKHNFAIVIYSNFSKIQKLRYLSI